jgi:predicted DNA-binding antitoxin AbrB/MazE fold protein
MIRHVKAIYEHGVLRPLEPLELADNEIVSLAIDAPVSPLANSRDEPTNDQLLRLAEESGVVDFWFADSEDIYTLDDGEPIR